jgi:hypothetical protein
MATKKQKEELIEILRFQPITVTMTIQGYGGETYAGTVDRKIYDYFKSRKIDISEYASDWDNEMEVPDDMQPFPPGSPYECDDLWHACGGELSDLNRISLTDQKGDTLWEHSCGYNELEESGVKIVESSNREVDDLPDGTVVHWGGQGEKGCFFEGEFVLKAPFDPSKLEITYDNCDDWYIITSVYYDGEEIDGNSGYSTTGKWSENKWVIAGGEEVYEPSSIDDDDVPVLDGEETQAQEEIDRETDRSPWWSSDVKPELQGEYEVMEVNSSWPFPTRAIWNGKTWKEGGKKINVKEWRGLNYDPSSV